jgi:heme/copper-type cytochrome/quinol oxidase subunit 3
MHKYIIINTFLTGAFFIKLKINKYKHRTNYKYKTMNNEYKQWYFDIA